MRRFLFWLRAKTRHGTHSPFIYRFLDHALYRQPRGLPGDYRLLRAAAAHFEPERAGAGPGSGDLAERLRAEFPEIRWGEPPFDLYLFGRPQEGLTDWLSEPGNYHDGTVVFTSGLALPGGRRAWKAATSHPRVRVSLETWRAGLLFFREGQAPEHFKIRI